MPFSSSFFFSLSSLAAAFCVLGWLSAAASAAFSLRCWADAGDECNTRLRKANNANNDTATRTKRMGSFSRENVSRISHSTGRETINRSALTQRHGRHSIYIGPFYRSLLDSAGGRLAVSRCCMRTLLRKVWLDLEGLDIAEYAAMVGALLVL